MGVIYILTNPSFPEYVKLGYADDLEKRLNQLNRSECMPYAFRVYAIYKTNSRLKDLDLHTLIDTLNPELRSIDVFDGKKRVKEFYAMTPEDAYVLLECIAKISGTEDLLSRMKPEGHETIDEENAIEIRNETRRGPFRFSQCNIPIGSEVVYLCDDSIVATVLDERHISYNGETTSLSALAGKLQNCKSIQGPKWFAYNGKSLWELRLELENDIDVDMEQKKELW